MSSGFGAKGGTGRCYPVWENFTKCMSTAEAPTDCNDARSDYFECLHHQDEFKSLKKMTEQISTGGDKGAAADGHGH